MFFSQDHLFRARNGYRKGDDAESSTQSNPTNTQTDQRVGASENGIALGAGAGLDQSFTDNSQTTLNTTDNSNHSVTSYDQRDLSTSIDDHSQTTLNTYDQRDLSTSIDDHSQTTLNTYDQRDLSQNYTDNSSYADNSVHNDLSAEVAKAALNSGAASISSAASVLERQLLVSADNLRAVTDFATGANKGAIEFVGDAVGRLIDSSEAQTAAAAEQQTNFLKGFYTDRENSDVKTFDSVAKYAAGAIAVGALAWALK